MNVCAIDNVALRNIYVTFIFIYSTGIDSEFESSCSPDSPGKFLVQTELSPTPDSGITGYGEKDKS